VVVISYSAAREMYSVAKAVSATKARTRDCVAGRQETSRDIVRRQIAVFYRIIPYGLLLYHTVFIRIVQSSSISRHRETSKSGLLSYHTVFIRIVRSSSVSRHRETSKRPYHLVKRTLRSSKSCVSIKGTLHCVRQTAVRHKPVDGSIIVSQIGYDRRSCLAEIMI
jgi:hypothetical protein